MVLANAEANTKQPLRWGCRGSAGVGKERGMCEERHQRTWEAQMYPARAGRWSRPKEGEPRDIWESDQLI